MWSTLLLYLSIWALIAALARLLFASEPTSAQEAMPNAASLFCKTDKLKETQEKANGNSKMDVKTNRIFAPGSTLLRCNSLSAAQRHKLAYLEEYCCVLPACAASMRVLTSPTAFYKEMLRRIAAAEWSIVLSALYIADGPLSQHFVQCLSEKLEQWAELDAKETAKDSNNTSHAHTGEPTRTITLLLDYNRMKDKHNLAPIQKLLERAYDLQHRPHVLSCSSSFAVRLFLFQSPCRWNRLVAPFHRVQEALGVQHTKLFIFDHKHIVLTGANLSDDYFTTRMDRYLVIEDNAYVASWFTQLVMTLTELSHRVLTEAEYNNKSKSDTFVPVRDTAHKIVRLHATRLVMLPNALGADPSEDYDYFVKVAALKVREFAVQVRDAFDGVAYRLLVEQEQAKGAKAVLNSDANTNSTYAVVGDHDLHYDTVLFPTVQLGRLGIYHDSAIVHTLFATTTAPTERIFLTSPYLNLYHDFLLSLLNGPARVDCITASVEANGWTGQRGMAGYIPYFYLQLERTFYFLVKDYHRLDRVTLREFAVAGMTFHAKGLWFAREAKQPVGTTTTPKENNTLPPSLAVPSIHPTQLHSHAVSTLHDTLHTSNNEHVRDDDEEDEKNTVMYVSPLTAEEKQDIAAPYLVSYGSTNYGHRSVHKDVEAEAFVYTANDALREAQRNELLHVLQQSRVVTQERFVRHSRGRFQPVVSLLAQLGQDFL